MNKLIDIAFSGFWQFCGVMLLLSLPVMLIDNMFGNLCKTISHFKKKPNENQP